MQDTALSWKKIDESIFQLKAKIKKIATQIEETWKPNSKTLNSHYDTSVEFARYCVLSGGIQTCALH